MTIKSMTGFARADGAMGNLSWHWELRSVNGRGLDVRLRVPPGFEGLESRIRDTVGKRVTRGSLTVNLNVRRVHGQTQIQLNELALKQVLGALERLGQIVPSGPPSAEALLGIKGVLELVEPEEDDAEAAARAEVMLANLGRRSTVWCAPELMRGAACKPSYPISWQQSNDWWPLSNICLLALRMRSGSGSLSR